MIIDTSLMVAEITKVLPMALAAIITIYGAYLSALVALKVFDRFTSKHRY